MHTVKRSRNCFFIELRWYDKDRLSDGEIKYISTGRKKMSLLGLRTIHSLSDASPIKPNYGDALNKCVTLETIFVSDNYMCILLIVN